MINLNFLHLNHFYFEQSNVINLKIICMVPDYLILLSNMFKPLSTVSQRHKRSITNMDLYAWVATNLPNHKPKSI